jgi:hypothetical protein
MVGTTVQFETTEPLAPFLGRTIERVSFRKADHGKCSVVTFWHNEKDGTSVSSQMHDVDVKLEVGVLRIERIATLDINDSVINFPTPLIPSEIWKLQITKNGTSLESGLRFIFTNAQELIILPADFPCFLSILGNCVPTINEVSEYSIDQYVQGKIF